MLSADLRQKYLDFFVARGHKIITPAPLVPENDSTTLFTSAGMQPLIPYLLGHPHPLGKRLVNSQPSFRSPDIDEVGDNCHTTFFEMLGNWSLGDYFKTDQLTWIWEFLTQTLSLSPEKLWVSVFAGEKGIPRDEDSFQIWQKLGVPKERIYFYDSKKNWWSRSGLPNQMPLGEPGGPDSEIFYDFGLNLHHQSTFKDQPCHPNCSCGRFMEIGNSVFLEYQKKATGHLEELSQKNVDFGGGLERLLAAVNDDPDIFNTDLFKGAKEILERTISLSGNTQNIRVILDHLRASIFIIDAGITPSNKGAQYILRRLIRRARVRAQMAQFNLSATLTPIITKFTKTYQGHYPSLFANQNLIIDVIQEELSKFEKTLERGLKKMGKISTFDLYQTYGFPPEITQELMQQNNLKFDWLEFETAKKEHAQKSKTTSAGMFKSGLADQSEITTRYHTATHLLHQALRDVLGDSVHQSGSNITADRLRFDLSYSKLLSPKELNQVETIVNQKIIANLPVIYETMSLKKALSSKALANFKNRYPDQVTVYSIGNYSKEICAGPHVTATKQIGTIKIVKQESVGAAVRRLYLKFS